MDTFLTCFSEVLQINIQLTSQIALFCLLFGSPYQLRLSFSMDAQIIYQQILFLSKLHNFIRNSLKLCLLYDSEADGFNCKKK